MPDPRRAMALDLVDAALRALDPREATVRALQRIPAGGLARERCTVFAIGKAARGMAEAALERLGAGVVGGLVVGRDEGKLGPLRMLAGGHPVPLAHAAEHGRELWQEAEALGPRDTALCLISGGGSAMAVLPADGLRVEDLAATSRALLACGADIAEVNAIRRRLNRLSGGGLLRAMRRAGRVVNVLMSDVPGQPLWVVSSGPTLPWGGAAAGKEIVERYGLGTSGANALPAAALREIERAEEEPGPSGSLPPVETLVAADNETGQRAIVEAAAARGLPLTRKDGFLRGEAQEAGPSFLRGAVERCAGTRGAGGVVWGGETTVTRASDEPGVRGGRNHEFVLGALRAEPELAGGLLLSLGTDGLDGSSEAAGALADERLAAEARRLGLDAGESLRRHDSGRFFRGAGGQIVTGVTGTNVADLCLWLG
jgi:glycerate-2-kinase